VAGETLAANGPRVADAFALTADPSAYVPRLALEAALAELAEVVGKTPACAALSGEAGLGKTLLLHVLRERLLGAFECFYVPFPRLAAPEFWRWAAVATGLGSGEDDRGAVLGRGRRLEADGSGLVLLIDDAGALPASTRNELLAAVETPGLSVVFAFNSEDRAQLAALPAQVRRVDLGPPMTLPETRAYAHARLRRVDPEGALALRLTPGRLAALHRASGGVPARLHALLDAWLRGSPDDPLAGAGLEAAEIEEGPVLPEPPPLQARVEAALPGPLATFLAGFQEPRVRVGLIALVAVVTLGAWFLAIQRNPRVASVGVPVERLDPPQAAPSPPAVAAPAPTAAQNDDPPPVGTAPPADEPAPVEETPTTDPEVGSATPVSIVPAAAAAAPPVALAARSPEPAPPPVAAAARAPTRSLAPELPEAPPVPDPKRAEPTVHVESPRFPDEHVPKILEPEPLGAPPAGPRLSVNAQPWAEISLDGSAVGETPLGELPVAPGAHQLSARLPDGRVVERTVEARAGDLYVVFP